MAEDRAIRNVRAILHTTFSTEEEASPEQSATSGKNDKPTKLSLPSSSSTLGFLQSKQHDSRTVVFTDNGLGKKGGALSVRGLFCAFYRANGLDFSFFFLWWL